MGKPLSEFLQAVHDETRTVHTGLYFKRSLTRQYATYSVARTLLAPGSRILSLGAGGAFPETALARFDHAVVEIAEFPEIIERLRPFYEKMNFRCHPVDLSVLPHFTEKTYDLVLSCDCIEHLPLVPEDHLAYCLRHTAPGGHTLVVTNNLASLRNIARLAMGRSILPPTRDRQRPVTAENEQSGWSLWGKVCFIFRPIITK